MATSSESFTSIDQIESRPDFSPSLEITVESFSSLVGRYHLSESVRCQVKTEHGLCRQKHQNGYVGVTKEGKEGLIGGICGDKYFKEYTSYVQEKNRIDSEIERSGNIEKLRDYKDNFFARSLELNNLIKDIGFIITKTDHLYRNLPDIVLRYLYQAQKTKNWDLNVDVLRHTNKLTSNWSIEKLCTFPPLPSEQEMQSLLGKVENLMLTFNEACSKDIDNIPTPKLKNYVRVLSEFPDFQSAYNNYRINIEDFTQDHTLHNLYYACSKSKDKTATVRAILSINESNPSDQSIDAKCKSIEKITKIKFDNNEVRSNRSLMKYN